MPSKTLKRIVIFALVFAATAALAAWQPPTGVPPTNNAPAPLNVGDVSQVKRADLTLNNLELNTACGTGACGAIRFGALGNQTLVGTSLSLDYYSVAAPQDSQYRYEVSQLRLFSRV